MVEYNPVEISKAAHLLGQVDLSRDRFEHFLALSCLTVSQVCAGSSINMVIVNFCSWLDVSPASQPVCVDIAALNRVS